MAGGFSSGFSSGFDIGAGAGAFPAHWYYTFEQGESVFKNTASQKVTFFAFDYSTGAPKTGDAANLTAYVSKDDGAVTVLGDTSATELDATNAKGLYSFDLTQAETNADKLVFSCKSSTANVSIVPVTRYTLPPSFASLVIANGCVDADVERFAGSAGTFSSGRPEVNATHWGGTAVGSTEVRANIINVAGSAVSASSGLINANVTQLSGDSVAADNAEAFFDGTGYAGTNNVIPLVTTTTTATNVTTVNGLATGVITAASIAADAITDAKVASDVTIASVTGSVGSVTGNVGGNVVGSVGSVVGAVGSVTARVTANTDQLAGQTVTAAAGVTFPTSVASPTNITAGTITTATNVTTVNGLAAGVITAAAIATDAIDADALAADAVAEIQSGLSTHSAADVWAVATRVLTANTNLNDPTAAAIADAVWDEVLSGHLTAGSTGNALNAAGSAGDPWTTTLPGSYTGSQAGKILSDILVDTGTTLQAELDGIQADTEDIQTRLPAALVGGRIDASVGAMAANTLTASALATDAAGEIADAVWDEVLSGHLTAGTTGYALNASGSAGDPWSTSLPGAYSSGTAGYIIGTNVNATVSSRASQTSVDDLPTNAELATALDGADDAVLAAIAALSTSGAISSSSVETTSTGNYAQDLVLARNRIAAIILAVVTNPKPTYSLEGQSVSWESYLSMLLDKQETINKAIQQAGSPFQKSKRGRF